MKIVDYIDDRGRKYRVELPDDAPDSEAPNGIPVGPPDIVDQLDYPEPFATRLHNALFDRGLWRYVDVKRSPNALQGAIMNALRVDVSTLATAYHAWENPPELSE